MPHNHTVIVLVQVLHGICYAFYFATVYIFIDAAFPKDVRASAQGLFNLLILGLGDLAAKWLFIPVDEQLEGVRSSVEAGGVAKEMIDYQKLFLVPTGLALVAAIILAIAFHPPKKAEGGNRRRRRPRTLASDLIRCWMFGCWMIGCARQRSPHV
jgi:MFS family permease